jgi:ABC-type glycerol-3-phosphate transport system permease component
VKRKIWFTTLVVLILAVIIVFTIFPFLWMISVSFKPPGEVYAAPRLFPHKPTLEGYRSILIPKGAFSFKNWISNSLVVAVATTVFSLIIATLGGYGLSRFRFRGKPFLCFWILTTQVIPGSLLIIPLYIIMVNLNLLDSLFGLVLAYTTFSVPFCTWMMKGYCDSIPTSIDEAAMVDGANRFIVFWRVVLPLTIPGLVATGIFSFIAGWNEYLFANVFMRSYGKWTLAVGIQNFQGQYDTNWGTIMAGAVLIAVPIVFLFFLMQKHLVSGMTAGAVKQ